MKTGHQVQTDVFSMLKGSALVGGLSGGLYRQGLRPRDSKVEDCIVIFTTADAEQVQEGVVTINVYVPDIYPYANSVPVENVQRCEAIEGLLQEWVEEHAATTDYYFSLKSAVHTQRDEEIHQSFVVARLSFRILDLLTN
jgi:hypothetical protein